MLSCIYGHLHTHRALVRSGNAEAECLPSTVGVHSCSPALGREVKARGSGVQDHLQLSRRAAWAISESVEPIPSVEPCSL